MLVWLIGCYAAAQALWAAAVETARLGDRRADRVRGFALGPRDAARCAVLLHGFADTPEAWRREAAALAARGWRVIVPALSHRATERTWLRVAGAWVRRARRRHARVELWGHSMGGAVALAAAAEARPDALVLWAPFVEPWLGRRRVAALHAAHRLCLLWPRTFTFFPAAREGKGPEPTAYRVGRVIPVRTFAAMLRMGDRARLAAREGPPCPVTVLLSRRDTVVDNAATLRALPGARVRWAADARSGHALTNAADWRENLAAVLQ